MRSLSLDIRGLGHVRAMKNHKMLTRGRIISDPDRQKWARKVEDSIVSQLFSASQTIAAVTETTDLQAFWTFVSGLSDDSLSVIPEAAFRTEHVDKGNEGATITIDLLDVAPK